MRKLLLLLPFAMVFAAGCDTGDVKVEKYETKTETAPQDDRSKAINSNPNIPDAAKKAMGAK